MRVTIEGRVPVYVVVDTDTGEIERVIVDDENFRYQMPGGGCVAQPSAVQRQFVVIVDPETGNELIDFPLAEAAVGIAEDSEWPSWEFGW